MKKTPELVVMLTKNDHTVPNAAEIFEQCKNSSAKCFGFKEKPLSEDEMKELFSYMRSLGKETFLEVVEYTEEEGLKGAEAAVRYGCDALMGTVFFDSINEYCKENNIKYFPFVGEVTERPSILNGSAVDMIKEANEYIAKGASGIDFLGYRYTGDCYKLCKEFVKGVNAPVCIAGSVDSYQRLDEILEISPYSFTIGGAFFDKKFGDDICEQINTVCAYLKGENKNA